MGRGARALVALGLFALPLFACERQQAERGGTPAETRLDAAEVAALLEALAGAEEASAEQALARVANAGDRRFVPALVELLWAAELGFVPKGGHNERVLALEHLSGERLGASWFAWAEWEGTSHPPLPPGFGRFKARLAGRIDPAYAELLSPERVDPETALEIHWSGAGSIPALRDPATLPAREASWLEENEPVVGVFLDGAARAYPLRILDWHEVANDVVGGVPVCVVSCPLCGSASAWRGSAPGGERREFAATGLLLRSTSLLQDVAAKRLLSPISLAAPGDGGEAPGLDPVPVVVAAWKDWRGSHPETSVLSLATGYERPYVPGQPYADYFASDGLRFPVAGRDGRLAPKARVYGMRRAGSSVAFPVERLTQAGVVNDRVRDLAVALVATRGTIRAVHGDRELGLEYEAGAEVRAYAAGRARFAPGPRPEVVLDEQRAEWTVTEDALVGPGGEQAPRVPGLLAYWFAWSAFFPQTELR